MTRSGKFVDQILSDALKLHPALNYCNIKNGEGGGGQPHQMDFISSFPVCVTRNLHFADSAKPFEIQKWRQNLMMMSM